jgi:transcriptional regulator with XRE-family HTH domain
MKLFWDNIVKLLSLKKIPRTRLAEYLGRSQSSFSHVLSGIRPTYYKDMEKAAEFFGLTVPDLLDENFIQILEKERRAVSEMNGKLSQEVPIDERELQFLQELNIPESQALKLHRIYLIKAFPPSKKNLAKFVIDNQVGTIVTTHGGEDVFGFQIPNDSLEPVCAAGSILVFDARININSGDFIGMLYKGLPLIRKLFYLENSLILQTPSGQEAPQIIDHKSIDYCFKAVECVKKL